MASRYFQKRQALEKEVKDIYAKIQFGASTAATALLNITADITLTSVAAGDDRNTTTFTLEVAAAAANPSDTILADFTGTAAAIVCTITPNDGTNNGATPVDLTTAELRELISTGSVVGKNVTITDGSSLRALQTATGGGATALADGGEGDGVVATFSGGAVASPSILDDLGIASISRSTKGVYSVVLHDAFYNINAFEAILELSSAADIKFHLVSQSVSSKAFSFRALTGASVVDPSSSAKAYIKMELKNSSVV
jgi:hypothetical protein